MNTQKTIVLVLLFIGGLALRAVGADQWPQFRGPTGQGLATATNVPLHWSATTNIAWKTDVPGKGWSSPIIAGGRIYLTTGLLPPGTEAPALHALCLDAAQGQVLWDVEVFKADPAEAGQLNSKNSLASPTPIASGDRLYVHFGHMGTAALDLAGKILWRQTSLKYPSTHGNGGSPALVGDTLVFNCDGGSDPCVAALDIQTGIVRWKTARHTTAGNTFSFCTPLEIQMGETREIVSPGSGFVGAYDPRDGREIWRVTYGEGYSVVPRPVFAHGLLFVNSGYDRATLLAIRPQNAHGDVTQTRVAWRLDRGAPLTPSPLVVDGELYVVSDSGIATCADAKTGKLHWNERLGGGFSASPVYADGRVYFQNEAGVGFVVRQGTTFELLAKNDLHQRTLASYAVIDNAIFIRSESSLWRIGAK